MSNKSTEFDSIDLISFLWKSKKILIILGISAIIISSIVSLLMQEMYLSTVTLFPTKSSSVNFSETISENQSVTKFGDETDAESMLQILESAQVRDKIIDTYNLMTHYGIDTTSHLRQTHLIETYYSNITFNRNKNGAVLVKVLDPSPDTAALIANHIAELFDSTKNDIIHQRAIIEFEIKKRKLIKLQNEMNYLRDTMSKISSLGIATDEAYQGVTNAMIAAKDEKTKNIYLKKIEVTEKFGPILSSFLLRADNLARRLAIMETSYEQSESAARSIISHKFVVELARAAEKKKYPIRWLIVVLSTLSTLFFTVIILLFVEKLKELNSRS